MKDRIWKGFVEDLYTIGTQEHVAVHMCGNVKGSGLDLEAVKYGF